jgi:hypothetical protein
MITTLITNTATDVATDGATMDVIVIGGCVGWGGAAPPFPLLDLLIIHGLCHLYFTLLLMSFIWEDRR